MDPTLRDCEQLRRKLRRCSANVIPTSKNARSAARAFFLIDRSSAHTGNFDMVGWLANEVNLPHPRKVHFNYQPIKKR